MRRSTRSGVSAARAVIDHNIWISSFLGRHGAPARLRTAYFQRRFVVVTAEPLLAELEEVLHRPRLTRRGISPTEVDELLILLRDRAELAPVTGRLRLCRDPDDDLLIETALTGKADALVTGDRDLLTLADLLAEQAVRVLSVAEFLRVLDEE